MPESRVIETAAPPSVATFTILSEGQQVSREYHVASIVVTKELNRIPSAMIVFQDGDSAKQTFPISDGEEFIPGKKIEIKAGYRAQEETIFKGIVIKNSVKVRKNTSLFMVECRDAIFQAAINMESKYFKEVKDCDVIDELLGKYEVEKKVSVTKLKYKELVQFQQTDWDFILERAALNGYFCNVDDGKIEIKKPDLGAAPAETVQFGSSLLELDLEMDARKQFNGLKTTMWNYTEQNIEIADAEDPTLSLNGNISAMDLAKVAAKEVTTLALGNKIESTELQNRANAQMLMARLEKIVGRASFQGTAKVKAGVIVELKGVGKRFEGKVFISGVRHQIVKGNWTTDAQVGFQEDWLLFSKKSKNTLSATGLQVALVKQLEKDPLGEDRILLSLPLVSDKEDGLWARIATLDAGKERGSFFRPEVGDEVLVGFIDGDMQHPVVLGGLNSSKNPAPLTAKDDNDEKGFITRSKIKMIFDDKKKSLQIETPGGNILLISDDKKGLQFKDQNGNKIILDDKGITMESSKDFIVKAASGNVKLEGMKADIKASSGFKADGGAGCELSAGNGITVVKGGLVQIN